MNACIKLILQPIIICLLATTCAHASEAIDAESAARSMLSAKARLLEGKSFFTDENFDNALRYYEAANDTASLIDMYQLAAIKKQLAMNQDSAAHYIKRAINISSDTTTPSTSALYIKLSNLYARPSLKKDYNTAIIYGRQALKHARTDAERARALHDIGLFYSFQNNNDSAVAYIDKALAATPATNSEYTTYALNYANTPGADFNKSVRYLHSITTKSLGKLLTLGFIYLNHSMLDSAKHYLALSISQYNDEPSKYSINTFNNLMLLEHSIDMINTGTVLPSEGTVTNDSISEISAIQQKISDERRDYNNMLQVQLLQSKARRQLLLNISLASALLFVVIFGLFAWRSKRKFLKLEQKLHDMKIRQIVSEANGDTNEEESAHKLIMERLGLCIEQFRLSKLQPEIDKAEMQFRNTGSFPPIKNREYMQKALIGCFTDFIVDLKLSGAKLNIDDIMTCIMCALKESNTAIAICLGSTDTAVRTRKTRLRAKLPPQFAAMLNL